MNLRFALFMLLLVVLTGCQHIGPSFDPHQESTFKHQESSDFKTVNQLRKKDADLVQDSDDVFTLGPGDRVKVQIIGEPGSQSTVIVGPDGKIYYHLLSALNVWGLNLQQAQSLIENHLSKYFRVKPQVVINLEKVESKKVWILGRVSSPGVFELSSPTTLIDAISRAGGPSTSPLDSNHADSIDYEHSFVMRKGRVLPINFNSLLQHGDMSQNIFLKSEDFVYIPASGFQNIYVLGAVSQPRMVRFSNNMTLVSAMANVGGTVPYANLSEVAIVRGSLMDPKIAILDYGDIIKGKAPDVTLTANDLIYVPFTPYKALEKYVDLILNTFARTVGANEGARVVSPNSGPVGASVGITTFSGNSPGTSTSRSP